MCWQQLSSIKGRENGLAKLAELIDEGALRVFPDKTFPFYQTGAALRYRENQEANCF